jgi:tetratricopeptide (TPR) repeat protein
MASSAAHGNTGRDLEDGRRALEAGEARFDRASLERAVERFAQAARAPSPPELVPYFQARAFLALASWHARRDASDQAIRHAELAIAAGKTAVEVNPRHSDSHRVLGEALGRLIGLKGGLSGVLHGRRAQNELALALKLDPVNVRAHLARGISKLRTPRLFGGDTDEAIRSFQEAIRLAPGAWDAHIWLGIAYRERGDAAAARAAMERALSLSPTNDWIRTELAGLDRRR